jgi:hypothetical protein
LHVEKPSRKRARWSERAAMNTNVAGVLCEVKRRKIQPFGHACEYNFLSLNLSNGYITEEGPRNPGA